MRKLNFITFIFGFFISFSCFSQNISEQITFTSSNPFSFNDVIINFDNLEKQAIQDDPENKVLKNLGNYRSNSLGWKNHHYEYLTMYQNLGFATFELNSFKSRDIKSTVGEQNQVTTAAMIVDAYKALEMLSNHPQIIKEKVSITGWSLGGAVALYSAWLPLKNSINKSLNFASHLAFYPPCFFDFENMEFSQSPIHILIGELDDWTPAEPCNNLVNKLNDYCNIDITISGLREKLESMKNGYSFKDCMFTLTSDGNVLMNYLNMPMSNAFLQKLGFLFCASKGVTIGGNLEARNQSFEFAKEFMINTLMSN